MAGRSHRHRRPSGEPPPLPRSPGWGRVALAGYRRARGRGPVGPPALRGRRDRRRADRSGGSGIPRPRGWSISPSGLDVLGAVAFVARSGSRASSSSSRTSGGDTSSSFLATFVITDWIVLRLLGVQRHAPPGVESLTDQATFWFPSRPVVGARGDGGGDGRRARRRRPATSWAMSAAVVGPLAGLRASSGSSCTPTIPLDALYAVVLGPVVVAAAAFAVFVPGRRLPRALLARRQGRAPGSRRRARGRRSSRRWPTSSGSR